MFPVIPWHNPFPLKISPLVHTFSPKSNAFSKYSYF